MNENGSIFSVSDFFIILISLSLKAKNTKSYLLLIFGMLQQQSLLFLLDARVLSDDRSGRVVFLGDIVEVVERDA
jgi:hypothetical protein